MKLFVLENDENRDVQSAWPCKQGADLSPAEYLAGIDEEEKKKRASVAQLELDRLVMKNESDRQVALIFTCSFFVTVGWFNAIVFPTVCDTLSALKFCYLE